MKNILFVLHGSNKDSGATKSLLDIIDKLQELNKYKIYVIIPDHMGNVKEYLEKKNIDVFIYKYGDLYQSLSTPLIKRMLKIILKTTVWALGIKSRSTRRISPIPVSCLTGRRMPMTDIL